MRARPWPASGLWLTSQRAEFPSTPTPPRDTPANLHSPPFHEKLLPFSAMNLHPWNALQYVTADGMVDVTKLWLAILVSLLTLVLWLMGAN